MLVRIVVYCTLSPRDFDCSFVAYWFISYFCLFGEDNVELASFVRVFSESCYISIYLDKELPLNNAEISVARVIYYTAYSLLDTVFTVLKYIHTQPIRSNVYK